MKEGKTANEILSQLEAKYGSDVLQDALRQRLEYKGVSFLETDPLTDDRKTQPITECVHALSRLSWGEMFEFIRASCYRIIREGLLVSLRTNITEEEIFQMYVPCDIDLAKLKQAVDSLDSEIEEYGKTHFEDYSEIDLREMIKKSLEEHEIFYTETFPDLIFRI